MIRRRALICLVTSGILLLSQLPIWGARGCSMCGASCRCASHGSAHPCSVRSVGCGGGDGGAVADSVGSPRAVLADSPGLAPQITIDTLQAISSCRPSGPARPPLDRPPRVSC